MTRHSGLFLATFVFTVLGTLNAGYLSFSTLSGAAPICNFIHDCDLVASSPLSRIFGVPLALPSILFRGEIHRRVYGAGGSRGAGDASIMRV